MGTVLAFGSFSILGLTIALLTPKLGKLGLSKKNSGYVIGILILMIILSINSLSLYFGIDSISCNGKQYHLIGYNQPAYTLASSTNPIIYNNLGGVISSESNPRSINDIKLESIKDKKVKEVMEKCLK
jgi:hypothetical protein